MTSTEFAQQNADVAAKAVEDYKSSDELHNMRASNMLSVDGQLIARINRHIPCLNLDFLYEPSSDDEDSPAGGEGDEGSGGAEGADGSKDDSHNEA